MATKQRNSSQPLARWRSDPVRFITEVLRNPETGQPFELYPAEAEFLRRAFTLTPEGKLPVCPCSKKASAVIHFFIIHSALQFSTLSCPDILDKDVSGLGEGVEDSPALFASG